MGSTGDDRLSQEAVAAVRAALSWLDDDAGAVLAVSGGPDSVGLAHLVTAARPDLRATVVHVRHGLRDDARDAEVAALHAAALGLECQVLRVWVGAGSGPEDAARQQRLEALRSAAVRAGAGVVMTGHTADDQAETVLLNIARGSGLPGVAGMAGRRDLGEGVTLAHPLLDLRRATVRAVAMATGLPLALDPTNTDPLQRRSRARTRLLPMLADLTGGATDPVPALARLAAHARRDTEALDAMAAEALHGALKRWGPAAMLPSAMVDALPDALATRVARLLVTTVAGTGPPPAARAVADVLGLADGHVATLPGGVLVSRGSGRLAAVGPEAAPLPTRAGSGTVVVPELGLVLARGAEVAAAIVPPWAPPRAAANVAVDDGRRLEVRSPRRGDRIRTRAGTQRVWKAMADAGVPRAVRDLVPVVADEEGVLWVPGCAVRAGAAGSDRAVLVAGAGQ
jgi:tRNA(Ile)-lysidine synthase